MKLLDRWLPPPGAGAPVGCIATSFTFDQELFEQECLPRFLNRPVTGVDDAVSDALAADEALSEAHVGVLLDQSACRPDPRNLRWDLLAVQVPNALLHAKVVLLHWERFLRVVVGSANMTNAGYRRQAEIAMAFEAHDGTDLPGGVFEGIIDAVTEMVGWVPGTDSGPGPKRRTRETLARMRAFVASLDLPGEPRRGDPRITTALTGPGQPPLFSALAGAWPQSGPPRQAYVMSPYYDENPGQTAAALEGIVAQRGERSITFLMQVDELSEKRVARASSELATAFNPRADVGFQAFESEDRDRRMHAKGLMLCSDDHLVASFGSSNFTRAGTGIGANPHVELNMVFSVRRDTDAGDLLWRAIPDGKTFDPADADWMSQPDDEVPEAGYQPPPPGFVEALFDPGDHPVLRLIFDAASLPQRWHLAVPGENGATVYDSGQWHADGCPDTVPCPLPRVDGTEARLLHLLQVTWVSAGVEERSWLVVNVTDPAKLPPPEDAAGWSLEDLMAHLGHHHRSHGNALGASTVVSTALEDDPLKRYTSSGFLLQRVRRFADSLAGLSDRLQRPAHRIEALRWRLFGPLGPEALARAICDEAARSDEALDGEPAFLLAELALMLSRLDWTAVAAGDLTSAHVAESVAALQVRIREDAEAISTGPALAGYVAAAFAEACP